MAHILLVEDDILFAELLEQFLVRHQHQVSCVGNGKEAQQRLSAASFDLVLCDYRLPDTDGLTLLKQWKLHYPGMAVIIMTAYSDIRLAIQAIKMGARDYIIKPIQHEELLHAIQNALASPVQKSPEITSEKSATRYFGHSDKALALKETLDTVAGLPITVLLMGESGTGKEYAARYIHENSDRSAKPFIAIDCGALTEELAASELFGHSKGAFTGALQDKMGAFEAANGGTLFLDEIGNLSYEIQVMLLRVIQEKQIRRIGENITRPLDIRLLAATNEDLRQATQKGHFREDLFHRLNEFDIQLPALRDRQEDIQLFAHLFLKNANHAFGKTVEGIQPDAMQFLMQYSWPGNLRELNNVIRRAVIMSKNKLIDVAELPLEIKNPETAPSPLALPKERENREIDLIKTALERCRYNKTKAAEMLEIDRKTLYAKMKKYGLD
jgi:two-component system response regulator HydG